MKAKTPLHQLGLSGAVTQESGAPLRSCDVLVRLKRELAKKIPTDINFTKLELCRESGHTHRER